MTRITGNSILLRVGNLDIWTGLEENTLHLPLSFALSREEKFVHLGLLCFFLDVSWYSEDDYD